MWYIVYRNPFKSYNYDQGNGYFVRYKDKLSDEFSPNWFEASKYITISGAVTRLGVYGYEKATTLEDFIKTNDAYENIGFKRNSQLNKIFNIDNSDDDHYIISEILNNKGRIDKIDDNGEFLGDAIDEVVEFIKSSILSNKKKLDKKIPKYNPEILNNSYIIETKECENFWDVF